jgi:hypothetical protein
MTGSRYYGMAKCMDQSVANVTAAHKAHGGAAAWSNTLVVFSAVSKEPSADSQYQRNRSCHSSDAAPLSSDAA